jgi:hypothetical protein
MENSPQLQCQPVPEIANSASGSGPQLLATETGTILTDETGNPISLD